MDIRESYDSAASRYAESLSNELDDKPLDRHLLNRFAEEVAGKGLVGDIGCGPGHIAAYLSKQGVNVYGVDLSPEMVAIATKTNPDLEFCVEDMRHLSARDKSLAGLVLFYSIVHFSTAELQPVFREMRRVLADGGCMLIAFHDGEFRIHCDELFGAPVSLDFHAHHHSDVIDALRASGFSVREEICREPYPDVEYPSRRCYLIAKAAS